MPELTFTILINASKEKVWQSLWEDLHYREWTSVFSVGSYAESDWNEGSKISFLSPGGNGMYGIIEKKIPNKEMVFHHLGEVKDGVEEKKDWAPAKEKYFLQEDNGITTLTVTLETNGDFDEYFNNTFPKAMEKLKEIAER